MSVLAKGRRVSGVAGFTLVELLVVIGIIALLISILLPSLNRAREAARAVQCRSNMRQIVMATMQWAGDHKGKMPTSGNNNSYYMDASNNVKQAYTDADIANNYANIADWICWQRYKDPFTGQMTTAPMLNITYSALTRYLGAKNILSTSADQANQVNPALDSVFRCPSDNVQQRNSTEDASHGWYRYSYTINPVYAGLGPNKTRNTLDGKYSGKIWSIHLPSERILFVCEDERTIANGEYATSANSFMTNQYTHLVASRHDMRNRKAAWGNNGANDPTNSKFNEDCRGNVAFADGHVDFFSRKDATSQRYTGSATADPAGF